MVSRVFVHFHLDIILDLQRRKIVQETPVYSESSVASILLPLFYYSLYVHFLLNHLRMS